MQQRDRRAPAGFARSGGVVARFDAGAQHAQRFAEVALVPKVVAHRQGEPHQLVHAGATHGHHLTGRAGGLNLVPLSVRLGRPLRVDLRRLGQELAAGEQRQSAEAFPGPRASSVQLRGGEAFLMKFRGFRGVVGSWANCCSWRARKSCGGKYWVWSS